MTDEDGGRDGSKPRRVKKKRWNQTSQPTSSILKTKGRALSNKIAPLGAASSVSFSSSSEERATSSPVSELRLAKRAGVTFSGDVLVRKRSASVSPPRSPPGGQQQSMFGKDWTPPGSSGGND